MGEGFISGEVIAPMVIASGVARVVLAGGTAIYRALSNSGEPSR